MTTGNTEDLIELRVDEIAQLFHTLDYFLFENESSPARQRNSSSVGRGSYQHNYRWRLMCHDGHP